MGNCKCEIHYYKETENEPKPQTLFDSNEIKSNTIKNIPTQKNNYSEELEDITELDLNPTIQNKILKLGAFIPFRDYHKLIKPKILEYIKSHKLNYQEYCPSKSTKYKSNPLEFENGNIYYGEWNNEGEMEGYGIYILRDKNIISEGIWIKGNIIYGRIFFPNEDIYEGKMNDSLPHGFGIIYFLNGEIYKGDFVNGEMTGNGTFIYADKSYYTGELKNGVFHGLGTLKWNNGTEYHGYFDRATLSGEGKIYNDLLKEKYIGNFDKNDFNFYGVYTYKNGDVYKGNFEKGIRQGKGKYIRNDGVEFDIQWNNDLPNGSGVVIYNGNQIKGNWREGNMIGKKELIKGNLEVFNEIDLNLEASKRNIFPASMPYIDLNDNEESEYALGTDMTPNL